MTTIPEGQELGYLIAQGRAHAQTLEELREDIQVVTTSLKAIQSTMDQAVGAKKLALMLGSAAGAAAGFVASHLWSPR